MLHLRSNSTFGIRELDPSHCTFPRLFLCLQAKNKENLSGALGSYMLVLFHLLTACRCTSHAAHTADLKTSEQLLDAPSFHSHVRSETTFSQFLNLPFSRCLRRRVVRSFLSCCLSRSASRGAGNAVNLGLICESEDRMKGPGHCSMQAVNYSGSNEIKLIKAIS